jgi:hypothetical protein
VAVVAVAVVVVMKEAEQAVLEAMADQAAVA